MAEKRPYRLTDRAGTFVAGRRIRDRGATLYLTDTQAEHELRLGSIELITVKASKAPEPARGKK